MNLIAEIALSFLKKTWYIWAIAALSFLLVGSCAKNQLLNNRLSIVNSNYEDAMRKTDRITKEYNLRDEEYQSEVESVLNEAQWLRDSISKLKIKIKNTTKIQTYSSVKVIRDTVVKIKYSDVNGLRYNEISKEGCNFKVIGGWFEGDTIASMNVTIRNDLAFVNYYERRPLFGIRVFPKWGKRFFTSIAIDKCQGDTILNNQTFNKIK